MSDSYKRESRGSKDRYWCDMHSANRCFPSEALYNAHMEIDHGIKAEEGPYKGSFWNFFRRKTKA